MRCCVIARPDGGVTLVGFPWCDPGLRQRRTDDEIVADGMAQQLERLEFKYGPGCQGHECDDSQWPSDHDCIHDAENPCVFRDAWTWDGAAVVVDRAKALEMIRETTGVEPDPSASIDALKRLMV